MTLPLKVFSNLRMPKNHLLVTNTDLQAHLQKGGFNSDSDVSGP